jgi:hypothetical protein
MTPQEELPMVQPYPAAAQMPGAWQPPVPASVRNAVTAMYAGAAAEVVHALLYILTRSSTRAAYIRTHPRLTAHDLVAGWHLLVISGVISSVIGAALFIWMAQMCRRGRNWARITGTIFFGLGALAALAGLRLAVSPPDKIFAFVIVLSGLAAVILLWQRGSGDYFDASAGPVS